MKRLAALACLLLVGGVSSGQINNLEFDDGVAGWRTVLDGVMGGLSTGTISSERSGVLTFRGDLSLENNGGFSQIRTNVREGLFADADGVTLRVRGDGRTYQFNVRTSNVRMMAGGYERQFVTIKDEWTTLDLDFDNFVLTTFGREVRDAPPIRPELIESVGFTLADGTPGPFALEVDFIRPLNASEQGGASGNQPATAGASPLGDIAADAGLTTLLKLAEVAGVTLPSEGRFTVLAPTNDAFAALDDETVEFLTSEEGRSTLRTILLHHVLPGAFGSSEVLDRRELTTLAGQAVSVAGDRLQIGGAGLVAADVPFDQGVVHVIDAVLMPETRSIAEIASATPELSTLVAAVQAAGLVEQLGAENPGPMTVLAPTNAAFEALGTEAIQALLADRRALTEVLGGHVLPIGLRSSQMLAQGRSATLLGGKPVDFALKNGKLTVSGVGFVTRDIPASNGVIHIIDQVILPDAPTRQHTRAADASPDSDARQAASAVLLVAIERGVPLFNAGQERACAEVYATAVDAVLLLGRGALTEAEARDLQRARGHAMQQHDARERAWVLRRGMDALLADLEPRGMVKAPVSR